MNGFTEMHVCGWLRSRHEALYNLAWLSDQPDLAWEMLSWFDLEWSTGRGLSPLQRDAELLALSHAHRSAPALCA